MAVDQVLVLNAALANVSTSSPSYPAGIPAALSMDTSGGLRVHIIATDIASASFGSAFPTTGTAIGVKNGANMVNLTADASNNLNVNIAANSFGTITIAGNVGLNSGANVIGAVTQSGTWNVGLSTGANTIGAVNLAQYTPVAGRLPVDGSGVTQPISGTVTANAGTGTFTVSGTVTSNQGSPPWSVSVTGTAITTSQTTVGNTAAILVATNATRRSVTIRNLGTINIYVGPSSVTTANGFPIQPGEVLTLTGTTADIYAIAASAGVSVSWLQEA